MRSAVTCFDNIFGTTGTNGEVTCPTREVIVKFHPTHKAKLTSKLIVHPLKVM